MNHSEAKKILEKVQNDFNAIAESFSSTRQNLWGVFSDFLPWIHPGNKVLEVGCGNGRLTKILEHVKYTGIDFSPKLLEEAQKKFPDKKFQLGNIIDLPFPEKSFDTVFAIGVMHHLPGVFRTKGFEEIHRVLKPRGYLMMTNWDLQRVRKKLFLQYQLQKLFKKHNMDWGDMLVPWQGSVQRYYHAFHTKELQRFAKSVDFSVIRQYHKDQNLISIFQKYA